MKVDNKAKQESLDLAESARQHESEQSGFVAGLFQGSFRWSMLVPFPEQDLEDKRLGDEYIEKVRRILEEYIDPHEVDRTGELQNDALVALAEAGLFGLKIDEKYGGMGFSQTNYNRVIAYVSSYCSSTAAWLSAHQSIGVSEPLRLFGTEEQRAEFLPRVARGAISGFALTEPDVGSDPARLQTTATPIRGGAAYLLEGEKLWCTNGPEAELLVVMALTPPKQIRGKMKPQITAFVVETGSPGFEVVHRCTFMGLRGIANGLLRLNKVEVPAGNMIGEPGQGLKIALTTLNTGRLTMPAASVALSKVCMHHAHTWANKRIQWGEAVGRHLAVSEKLANMAADTFAMESMNEAICGFVDNGQMDFRIEAAIAKYFCTTFGWRIADDLVQVRGGRGYETARSLFERGEEPVPAERIFRDSRIARIIEGTDEIMRLFIAREVLDPHLRVAMPILLRRGSLWRNISKALHFYVGWYPRQWAPTTGGLSSRRLSNANRRHLGYIARTSKRLARAIFHSMVWYGPKLERQQLILRRFVDAGTDLFAMAVSLARLEGLKDADPAAPAAQDLADLFCRNARRRINENLRLAAANHDHVTERVGNAFMDGAYQWLTAGAYTAYPPSTRFSPAGSTPQPQAEEPEPPDLAETGVAKPDEEG